MCLHLVTISDLGCKYLDIEYKTPTKRLSVEEISKNKNHNIIMIEIVSGHNYVEFVEAKSWTTAYDMWIKLKFIDGRDDNVRRVKAKSLREQFDQIKIREDENIAK